jgi:pimeloyl-ACP methyl ester carboxylesterase
MSAGSPPSRVGGPVLGAVPSIDGEALPAPSRLRGRLAPQSVFPAGVPGYRARFLELREKERVRVVEIGAPGAPPMVFLPGWGCPVWDFHRTMPAVAAAGFRSIGIDLRGHGLSDMPTDPARYTTDAMIAHTIDVLDAVGVQRAIFAGHSMGGAIAAHLALRVPQRVRALALFAPIGFGDAPPAELGRILSPSWTIPLSRILLRRAVLAAGLRILYGDRSFVNRRNVDEYWAQSQFDGFVPAMRALLHRFRWTRFTDDEIGQLSIPGLLVRGSRDPIVSRPTRPMSLPSDWREIVLDGVGHLPHDESSDVVNRALIEMLSGLR